MRSFSSLVIEAPGDCSPSRKVVSKMISLSAMVAPPWPALTSPATRGTACARCRPETMRLERSRNDVRIHADAEQRRARRCAVRGRPRPARWRPSRSRARGSRARGSVSPQAAASAVDEGVDRAVAGALDAACAGPTTSTSAASLTSLPAVPCASSSTLVLRRRDAAARRTRARTASTGRAPVSSLPRRVHHGLHHLAELDLQPARQLQPVLALQQVGDAALARLAVDADHGLVAAAQVLRIDRQVGHVPDVAFLARGEGLLDRVLVRAGERGVDQVAGVRMARMHRQLVAMLDGAADLVDVGEVQPGCHALRVEIQRDVHQVEVAGALAVAEQAAFEAVGAGHHARTRRRRCRCRDRCADGPTARWRRAAPGCGASTRSCRRRCSACECSTVEGRLTMHLRSGVGCQTSVTASTTRLANASSVPENISGEYWKIHSVCGCCAASSLNRRACAGRQLDDAVLVQAQHHLAHHRRRGVVQVHDGALARPAATRRCGGSAARAPASAPGSSRRRGCRSSSISLRTKSNSVCEADGKPTSISLKPISTSVSNMRSLRGDVHRLDQRLVAVAQVDAAPDGRAGQHGVGPGAVRAGAPARRRGTCWRGSSTWIDLSSGSGEPAAPKKNGPLLVQTGR